MIVAIHQPQFMPWLGYFDKMDQAAYFVLLDNVQYKKNEWQNRNRIKSPQGPQWLTVPVQFKFPALITEVGIKTSDPWRRKHLQALKTNYSKAPHWADCENFLTQFYQREWSELARSSGPGCLLQIENGLVYRRVHDIEHRLFFQVDQLGVGHGFAAVVE